MKNELKKYYKDLIEEWKIDLALTRIECMGFPKSQWPDLMQELALLLLDFRYDPANASGAAELTVLYSVITQRLCHLRRSQSRRIAREDRYAHLSGPDDEPVEYPFHPANVPTADDVAEVVAMLDEFEREVCSALAGGSSKSQIPCKLDCDWHTVDKAVGRIREAFTSSPNVGGMKR